MTKKDFEAMAGAVNDARLALLPGSREPQRDSLVRTHHQVFDSLARSLADVCATQNARFNRAKFLAACGIASPNSK